MKKYLLFSFLILLKFNTFSQQKINLHETNYKKHDLKIGMLKLVVYPALEFEYEYLLNPETSIGGNVSYVFNDNHLFYDFFVDAFYRFYFNQLETFGVKGFFAQPFVSYMHKQKYIVEHSDNDGSSKKTPYGSLGLGFGIGQKWTNLHGFSFQIMGGIGRNFYNANDFIKIIPRFEIYLGYNF